MSARWNKWYAASPDQSEKRRLRQKEKRAEKRKFIVEYKDVPCMDCGEKYPHYVMDFDHRDPEKKNFNIAKSVDDNVAWQKLKDEIAKCDIVCANCHRKRTFKHKEFGVLV